VKHNPKVLVSLWIGHNFFFRTGNKPNPASETGPIQSNVVTTTQKTDPRKQYHPAASASKHHYALSTNNTPKATDRLQALTSPQPETMAKRKRPHKTTGLWSAILQASCSQRLRIIFIVWFRALQRQRLTSETGTIWVCDYKANV
jgi:hypothetical protein